MATNKLAAQVDRPLNAVVVLEGYGCLDDPGNLNTPVGPLLQRLCDGGSDGAIIHGVKLHGTDGIEGSTQVLLFVSDQGDALSITPSNTRLAATGPLPGVGPSGPFTVNVFLPGLNTPVPQSKLFTDECASGDDRCNTALVIRPGQYVYVGLSQEPLNAGQVVPVHVEMSGGYYGKPGLPPGDAPPLPPPVIESVIPSILYRDPG